MQIKNLQYPPHTPQNKTFECLPLTLREEIPDRISKESNIRTIHTIGWCKLKRGFKVSLHYCVVNDSQRSKEALFLCIYFKFKRLPEGDGDMAQLAVLAQDPGSVPNTHITAHYHL